MARRSTSTVTVVLKTVVKIVQYKHYQAMYVLYLRLAVDRQMTDGWKRYLPISEFFFHPLH